MFVPIDQLEREAPGSWYINVLAVLPAAQGQGIGSALIGAARDTAAGLATRGLSLIVSDVNAGARRLYARHGMRGTGSPRSPSGGWSRTVGRIRAVGGS